MTNVDNQFLEQRQFFYRWILKKLDYRKELAEDMVQELYIKIVDQVSKGNYEEQGKFRSWAIWIAKNMIIDYHRKENKAGIFTITDEKYEFIFEVCSDPEDPIEQIIIDEETADWVARFIEDVMKGMNDEIRKVFVLRIWECKSFKEIVEINEASIGTNLARMSYAKDHIKKKLVKLKIAI